jgi:MSHA biogenesis protein MshK
MASKSSCALLILGLTMSGGANALQDPTRPADPGAYFDGAGKHSNGGWSLQSILSSPERRIAIINGTSVREGDRIGNARVVRIQAKKVLLKSGGRTLTLRLLPESIKVGP